MRPTTPSTTLLVVLLASGCYGDVPGTALSPTAVSTAPTAPAKVANAALSAAVEAPDWVPRDPGRVTLHRLNRSEYDNTVRDLLGVDLAPAQDFPPDDHAYGFDNNAKGLALSPVLMEFYERAAGDLISEALRPPLLELFDHLVEAEDAEEIIGLVYAGFGVLLFTGDGRIATKIEVPETGTYTLTVRAWGEQSDDEPVRMAVRVGQALIAELDVLATEDDPQEYSFEVAVERGTVAVAIELLNGLLIGAGDLRTLTVDWLSLTGPAGFVAPPEGWVSPRDRLLVCPLEGGGATSGCARDIVASFAARAWRRPVADDEVDRLVALFELAVAEGLTLEEAIEWPLRGALVSPHFLFRVETDPDPAAPTPHPLTDHELATRLAYFLWSSMPDAALTALAAQGLLNDPDVLGGEVDRMLDDPRAEAFVDNFVGQWLQSRHVQDVAPDAWYFPDFDAELRASMEEETARFVQSFIDENRPLLELLTAADTFVDDRLSAHYGLPLMGPGWHRVTLPDGRRGGILRQGSTLTVTSYPTRTSPVKRGKWVLDQILCVEVPPPPQGVEGLVEPEDGDEPLTLREQLEKHRADPMCASCHELMDPIGLGMEHYDGVGAWRDDDAGVPINATGVLVTGDEFEGVGELVALLAADPGLARCITSKVFTYALGRGPEAPDDDLHLDAIADDVAAAGYGFRDLIRLVAISEPFRMRRAELPGETGETGETEGSR